MSRKIAFTRPALADVEDAQQWYDGKREGLGQDFLRALDAALARVLANPDQFPVRYTHFRRLLVRKFSYVIYYRYDRDSVVVHAVMHMARNPTLLDKRG